MRGNQSHHEPLSHDPRGSSRADTSASVPRARRSGAAEHLNVQVADLLAQRIAVHAEEISGSDLITAGCRKCRGQERVLDLPQHPVIKPGWRQLLPETREIRKKVSLDGRREPLLA